MNIIEFNKKFPVGTVVVTNFDTRRCIFVVGEEKSLCGNEVVYVVSPMGIDAIDDVLLMQKFGIDTHEIRIANQCEIDKMMYLVREQLFANSKKTERYRELNDELTKLEEQVAIVKSKIAEL